MLTLPHQLPCHTSLKRHQTVLPRAAGGQARCWEGPHAEEKVIFTDALSCSVRVFCCGGKGGPSGRACCTAVLPCCCARSGHTTAPALPSPCCHSGPGHQLSLFILLSVGLVAAHLRGALLSCSSRQQHGGHCPFLTHWAGFRTVGDIPSKFSGDCTGPSL